MKVILFVLLIGTIMFSSLACTSKNTATRDQLTVTQSRNTVSENTTTVISYGALKLLTVIKEDSGLVIIFKKGANALIKEHADVISKHIQMSLQDIDRRLLPTTTFWDEKLERIEIYNNGGMLALEKDYFPNVVHDVMENLMPSGIVQVAYFSREKSVLVLKEEYKGKDEKFLQKIKNHPTYQFSFKKEGYVRRIVQNPAARTKCGYTPILSAFAEFFNYLSNSNSFRCFRPWTT